MNLHFGKELRKELALLKSHTEILRQRTPSTGSRGTSFESFEQGPGQSTLRDFQSQLE